MKETRGNTLCIDHSSYGLGDRRVGKSCYCLRHCCICDKNIEGSKFSLAVVLSFVFKHVGPKRNIMTDAHFFWV